MRILHVDNNHKTLADGLNKLGCENHFDTKSDKQTIMSIINEFQGLIIRSRFPIDKEFLNAAKNLNFIARVGSGLENIDVNYATSLGIEVISSPEGNSNAVGEHALSMILSLFNKLSLAKKNLSNGAWIREDNRGEELQGKTVGIIGYGNTGKQFAKKLFGFEVEVICYDILPNVGNQYAKQVDLSYLKRNSDILSLHIPLNNQTKGLINSDFINEMSKPFWLINTSRGNQVITKDLINGLINKKIRGACLDVFEFENSSFEDLEKNSQISYLNNHQQVVLTPHVAGWTYQSKIKLSQIIVEKIKKLYFN